MTLEALRVGAFHSPLHRGSLWNKESTISGGVHQSSFSPLFIGEVSGTYKDITSLLSN